MFLGKSHLIGRSRIGRPEVEALLMRPFIAHEFPTNRVSIDETLTLMEEQGFNISQAQIVTGRLELVPGDLMLVARYLDVKGGRKGFRFTLWEILDGEIKHFASNQGDAPRRNA